jgi:hypothetical protein
MCQRFSAKFPRLCKRRRIIFLAFAALLQCVPDAVSAADVHSSPISKGFCEEMKIHKTLGNNSPVGCERLAVVKFSYFGFDGQVHGDGEIVVLDAAADRVARIFDTLLSTRFPIEKARPLNAYEGDDEASMADNNTSSFNDRPISGGSSLSLHAYGLAIDLNPAQNPFVQRARGTFQVSPRGSESYLKRSDIRPGMAEAIVDVFAENGFPIWGGDWTNPIDYQHFQVSRNLALKLIRSSAASARAIFESQVEQYRRCRQSGKSRKLCTGSST